MSGFKKLFGGGGEEEEPMESSGGDEGDGRGFTDSVKSAKGIFKLNWKERVIGFVICIVIAAMFVIVGCAVAGISAAAFAVLFSVGTIAAVCSTFFLVGPIGQAKKFVDFSHVPEAIIRISAAITVVLAVILAIVCGVLGQAVLAVLLAIVQFVALIILHVHAPGRRWYGDIGYTFLGLLYSITLIPFAMSAIVRGTKMLFSSA